MLGAGDYEGAFALLAEMTQAFANSADVQTTFDRALASIAAHVGAEAGSLWLVEGAQLACVASVGAHPITGLRLGIDEGIVGKCVREGASQSVLDVSQDPDFSRKMDAQSGFVTRSLLCAPMTFSEQVIGAVELINKRAGSGRFGESDAHLLEVLAASAGLAIANARLARAQVDHERVRRELELAAEIQRSLLPAPREARFPVHGVNVPARTVSGDFFDYLTPAPGRIVFCLGDVSGKGMNAALLMAKTASLFRCLAKSIAGPGALLARLNDEICETATRGMFVTMAAGLYDVASGALRLANAGHEPPQQRRPDGRYASLPAQAPPLGIVPGSEFPEREVSLDGGCLYVFSDGLTEARDAAGRELGAAGFRRLADRHAALPLRERVEAIAAEVSALELRDDLTLLGVCHGAG